MQVFVVSFVVLVLCSAGSLAQLTVEKLGEYSAACRKDNNVTDQEYELLNAGKLQPADATKNLKCSVKCTLQKSNFMDATGKYDVEAPKKTFAAYKDVVAALDKCKSVEDADLCQKAFLIADCVFNHKIEV